MGADVMERTSHKEELNEGFKALVTNLFGQAKSKQAIEVFEEIVNDRATVTAFNFGNLKQEIIKEVRQELATKDYVHAESAKTRQEMAEMKQELKAEMAEMKAELKADVAEVRQEMAEMKQELKAEMAEMKAELKADVAEVRQEMVEMKTDIIRWVVASQFTLVGIAVAIIKLL
ncbi:hypothetical protein CQA49_08995 [Helicobacter sp. MIT 00-7814]|uniref:coiled-coil domain-containing protein n=1 Tax=unclassified Helicobacter TaxID=2593540 RepID=UPI000E1F2656|nr:MULTISPECIES: coiled-coil domain-containing protein [unclassified Helicobacter]RDU51965.1 hypothetical protein CQA49_08995 [Helicobacter sp. MIT 00-7814]RDU54135.1 hypothetical protein CQA37_05850 [Helicobacter sp. MIT 99-10781]